jgi:hypothetical protein
MLLEPILDHPASPRWLRVRAHGLFEDVVGRIPGGNVALRAPATTRRLLELAEEVLVSSRPPS